MKQLKNLKTIIAKISTGLLVSSFFVGTVARAELITFDDLSGSGGAPIANGYAGLNWNNFYVLNTSHLYPFGYLNGTVSPNNVAATGFGNEAIVSGGTFTLNSAYLTAAWNDGLQVEVIGLSGGSTLYDNTYTLNTSGPSLITFDYVNVDTVEFISSGGVAHSYYGTVISGTQFAMDNLTINGVPDGGSSAAMLGGGLALLGALRRRILG